MKYTVIWKPSAEARLAQIWTEAHDRNAVALAANALDRLLQFDAESEGESRTGNIRITLDATTRNTFPSGTGRLHGLCTQSLAHR